MKATFRKSSDKIRARFDNTSGTGIQARFDSTDSTDVRARFDNTEGSPVKARFNNTTGTGIRAKAGTMLFPYFRPHVSEEGELSWTNNGGLENPTPVSIRGPKGDTGEQGPKGDPGDVSEAVEKAEEALTAAQAAQTTADGAAAAAGNAQSTANAAQTAAGNAQSTADAAQTAAGNAQSTANAAANAASAAQATANNKVDKTVAVPSGADLNTITTSGFYRINSNLINAPTGADWSQMIVSRGGDTIAQIIVAFDTAKMWVRAASRIGSTPLWTAWEEIGGWDLLWTNASPGSNFNKQTVNLNLTNYNEVLVIFRTVKDYGNTAADSIPLNVYLSGHITVGYALGKLAGRIWYVNANKTGIYFDAARFANTYGDRSENYSYMVPLYIFAR